MANKRLIDKDALIELCDAPHWCVWMSEIEDFPTVDAVEVVHGKWEKASETMPIYRCSICKQRNLFKNGNNVLSNYCHNCGSKMDLED